MPEEDAEFEADLAATIAEMAADETPEPPGDGEADELEGEELDETDDEEDLESDDADPDLTAAQAALDAGDLEALAKALGREPGAFDVSKRQFKAMRAGLSEAREAKRAAEKAKADADSVSEAAQKTYGPIVLARKAVSSKASGWQGQARAALEMIGFTPEVLGQLVEAPAAGGEAPAGESEVDKLRRELRERDEARERETRERAQAEEVKAQQAEVLGKLAGTPLEGREYAAAEIVQLVRDSYDPATKGYGVTLKAAYRQVKAKYVLGTPPAAPARPAPRGRRPLAPVRPPKAPVKLTPEQELEADIAAAQREAEAEERAARRARGAR